MRIGVISDTHAELSLARVALKEMGDIQLLLHAGDHYKDALVLAKEFDVEIKAIKGNCDFIMSISDEEVFELEGKKFLLTHGHQYGVKSGIDNLYYRGRELNVDIVIFGHTHMPFNSWEGELKLFNPGSISLPRGQASPTYGIIELGSEIKPEIRLISK